MPSVAVGQVTGTPLILVVEDDRETRRLYRTAFADAGFGTDEAHNGLQALEKAAASGPALVVTDISVPGIDGIELCRRLRADSRTSHVPVLAITGYDDRHYSDRALHAGADRILFKPVGLETLLAEARRLIDGDAGLERR